MDEMKSNTTYHLAGDDRCTLWVDKSVHKWQRYNHFQGHEGHFHYLIKMKSHLLKPQVMEGC